MADLKRRIVAVFSAQNKAKGETAAFRRDIDLTRQSMMKMAKGALAMAGIGGGLYAVKKGFDYVTKAAMKQEDALFLLEASLKAAGEYSAGAMKGFEAFAASIQQATIYGDEEVLALMQLMKSLGVTSNALEKATKMAIGLAAATGRDVRSMSMYIALAQQGEFTMLRRYIPALRSTTDATEQLRIITEFAARGFKIAEAQAETASGAITQMRNAYSDVAEVIGDAFLPSMKKVAKKQKEFLEEHKSALRDYLTLVAEGAEMLDWLSRKVLGYTPPALLYKAIMKPEEKKGVLPPAGGIIHFEEPEWLKATLALNVMTEAQKKAANSMYEMSMKARGLSEELAREKKITQFAALATERYGADVAGAQAAVERFTKALEESEAAKIAAEAAKKRETAAKDVERMLDGMQRELDMVGQVSNTWERSREFVDLHAKAIEAAAGNMQEYNRIMAEAGDIFEQLKLAERWAEISRAMESSFSSAMERMIFEGEKFGDAMKTVFREILMEAIRIQFIRPQAQALADFMGVAVSGITGAIFAGGGMPTVGTVPAASGATLAKYQRGGIATSPHLAMVGEVPEAFVPLSGGRSIPVEMRGGRGGITINVNNVPETYEISGAEEYMLGDERIINVFMQKLQTDGPLRRSIKQATR